MKAGDLLLFTSGEYSDYGVCGLARVLVPFDRVAEFKASMAARKAGEFPDEKFPTSCSTFALWLERRGLIDEVPYREVWFDDSWSGDMGDTLTAWEMEEPL